jgi:uncharacterized membrane protein YgcG
MKLFGTVNVHVAGEEILRQPGFLDKVKKAFGGSPDLRTGKMRASLEATAVVEAVRAALRTLGVSNAVSLMVDDIVLFQDREGKDDDLGDLFIAFHEQSSALGGGFSILRLAVETHEAGLHLVLEVQAQSEHAASDPAVRVVASGRIAALEPRRGEDADTYRARVEPLVADRQGLEVARIQFEAFVDRVREAIARAMPGARVELARAEARVERPSARADAQQPVQQNPRSRDYDPYMAYYPSPMGSLLSTMMWMSVFSMAMPPHYVVVDHHNHPTGHTDDPGAQHADPGDSGGDHGDASGGDDLMSHGDSGDGGGGFFDGGGDFGGGDFGGFD